MTQQSGLQKAIDALSAFDYEGEVRRIIEANKDLLADLLREQLAVGKDMDNKPITLNGKKGYKPFTINYKLKHGEGLGKITSHVTLYMSGRLYESIFTSVQTNVFQLKSKAYYFDDLIVRTGDRVTGLSEESRLKFIFKTLIPAFKKVFEQKTGLKLTSR